MVSFVEDGEIMDLSDESVQSPIIDVDVAPPMRYFVVSLCMHEYI